MNSFSYFNPVKLVYGPGVLSQVGKEILHLVDVGASVLVVYGGGSVKRTGVLDRVLSECRNAGFRCIERGGVRQNPTVELIPLKQAFWERPTREMYGTISAEKPINRLAFRLLRC